MGGVLVPDALACQVSRVDGYVVLRLSGELTVRTGPRVREVLRSLLLDRARVLVDLTGLTAETPAAVAVFLAALAATGGWPSARLVLFGARERMADALRRGGIVRSVPLAATREAAENLLHHRPERVSRCADLPADPYAATLARALIADACADWDLADRYDRAALIGTELVTNAVEHTGAASTLVLVVDRGVTGAQPVSLQVHRARQESAARAAASSRSRCGPTVYFGSFADAVPAWNRPNRVAHEAASSAAPDRALAARLRRPSSAPTAPASESAVAERR